MYSIARSYGVSLRRLAEANRIRNPARIRAGSRLVIPVSPSTPEVPAPQIAAAAPAPDPPSLASQGTALLWPAQGPVISAFHRPRGSRRHKGIDIKSPEGAPIKAAADGVVTLVSEGHGSYGRLVVVDHGDGVTSYYGHNQKNLVRKGQRVTAEETIALVGHTGNARGPHLHFEVRLDGKAVDPQPLLVSARRHPEFEPMAIESRAAASSAP